MLRALELFWLSFTIFCLLALVWLIYTKAGSETLIVAGITLFSAFKYYIRRKQRIAQKH